MIKADPVVNVTWCWKVKTMLIEQKVSIKNSWDLVNIQSDQTFPRKLLSYFLLLKGYIEVFDSNLEALSEITKNNISNDSTNQQDNDNWQEPVVRLRGLPYKSSKEDVINFFTGKSRFCHRGILWRDVCGKRKRWYDYEFSLHLSSSLLRGKLNHIFVYFLGLNHLVGLDIAQNGVHISSSKPAGEAFVAFTNMDNALRALEYNRMNMGHRYGKQFAKIFPFPGCIFFLSSLQTKIMVFFFYFSLSFSCFRIKLAF